MKNVFIAFLCMVAGIVILLNYGCASPEQIVTVERFEDQFRGPCATLVEELRINCLKVNERQKTQKKVKG